MKSLQSLWLGNPITKLVCSRVRTLLKTVRTHHMRRIIYALIITNAASVLLFGLRFIGAENDRYWFMLWNLTLAWVAPILAIYLSRSMRRHAWSNWRVVILTIIWVGFLPNSFYMVSDLIHVQQTGEVSIIFDAVLFASFIFNGFIAGYLSVITVHRELVKKLSVRRSYALITVVFFLCSYAIYLGRVLRWNTWDALLHPTGLIFDVSDTILDPLGHPQAFVVSLSFTLLITAFYSIAWELHQTFVRYSRSR